MKTRGPKARPRAMPIVTQARLEPLERIPFHTNGPITRWLMASGAIDPRVGVHVALHEMTDVEPATRSYCQPHVHECDELNVFHTTSQLEVEVRLGDEVHLVKAPATVVIPAGTVHAANVRSGSGFMVVVLLEGTYRATAPGGEGPSTSTAPLPSPNPSPSPTLRGARPSRS